MAGLFDLIKGLNTGISSGVGAVASAPKKVVQATASPQGKQVIANLTKIALEKKRKEDEAKAKVQAVINAQLQAKKLQNQTVSAPSPEPLDMARTGLAALETRFDPIQQLTKNIGEGYNQVRPAIVGLATNAISPVSGLLNNLGIKNSLNDFTQNAASGVLKKTFEDPIKNFTDQTLLARNKFQTNKNKNFGDYANSVIGNAANTGGLAMSALPMVAGYNAGVGALQGNERTKGLGDAADFVGSLPSQGLGALASVLPVSDEVKQALVMAGNFGLVKAGSKLGEGIGKRIDAGNLGRAASVVGKELTGKKATMFSGIDPTPFLKGVKEFAKNPVVQALDPTGITTGLGATSKATPTVDPLIAEALKYKTAEEFADVKIKEKYGLIGSRNDINKGISTSVETANNNTKRQRNAEQKTINTLAKDGKIKTIKLGDGKLSPLSEKDWDIVRKNTPVAYQEPVSNLDYNKIQSEYSSFIKTYNKAHSESLRENDTDETNPLEEEAKKYKSAEEFAQSKAKEVNDLKRELEKSFISEKSELPEYQKDTKRVVKEGGKNEIEKLYRTYPNKEKYKVVLTKGVPKGMESVGKEVWGIEKTQKTTNLEKFYQDKGDYIKQQLTDIYNKAQGGEPPIPPVPPKGKTSMDGPDGVPSRADVAATLGDKIDSLMQKTAGYSTKDPVAPMKKGILGTLMSPVSKLNDMYTGALRKGQDVLGTKLEQGLASENLVARNAATALQGFFRGIAMSPERETKGMQFKGGLDVANKRAYDVTESLYQLANKDPKVLERVNAVLDPELAKTKISFDDLTPTEKQLYGIVREGFDLVHDTSYANGNISPELYAQNKGKYTPRAYDTFELPDEITKALKQSGKKLDTGIYKERSEANTWKEEHALNDPVYSLGKRLAQVESNKVIKEYGDYIVSNPKFVSDVEKKGYTKLSDSPAYGELAGKHVLNNVAEDFKGFFFAREGLNSWYDGLKAFDSNPIRQGQKKSQTIYNPLTHLGNATSNIVFSFMAKVNPLTFAKEIASVTKDTARRKQLGDYLTREGILGTSVARGEFTNQLAEIRQLGSGEKKTALQKVLGVGKKIDDTVTGIYGGTDDLSKIAAFSALLKKGKSLKEATRLVSDGFQNYNKVGKFYDVYAKTPLIGSAYVKFKGDFLRMLKNAAVNSPLELAGFLMAMKAGADAVSSMSGESSEDKKTREERLGSPHIPLPNGDKIPLTWQTPFGEINVARYVSPMYNFQGTDDEKKNALGQYASYLPFGNLLDIAANYKKDPAGAAASAMSDPTLGPLGQALLLDRDFRGKQISDPDANKYQPSTLTPEEQQGNTLNFLRRAYTPPALNNIEDFKKNVEGGEDFYGKTRTLPQSIAKMFGVKVEQFGPKEVQDIRDKTAKYEEAKQNSIEKNIGDIVKKVLSGERTEEQGRKQILQYNDADFNVEQFAEEARNKQLLKKTPIPKTPEQAAYAEKKAEMSTKKNQILLQRMQELAREGTAEEALTALRAKYPRLSEEAIAKIVKDTREGKTY